MWVMVAGPYRAPTEEQRAANLRALREAALALFRLGHVPILGLDLALPLVSVGGEAEAVVMPLCLRLVERCDACLRIGGPSVGADAEVARFLLLGRPVYRGLGEVPPT